MRDLIRLLSFPATIVAGWIFAKYVPRAARLVGFALPAVAMLHFLVVAAASFGHVAPWNTIHRWGAHGFVILLWLGVPFAIGMAVEAAGRRGIMATAGLILLLLMSLAVAFSASITGYLGPSTQPDLSPEGHRRFAVLHGIALPLLLFGLLLGWLWHLRPTLSKPSRSGKIE
ncbi:MAG: hypothetical protein WD872_00790 [Pirellulaceae bacterium]